MTILVYSFNFFAWRPLPRPFQRDDYTLSLVYPSFPRVDWVLVRVKREKRGGERDGEDEEDAPNHVKGEWIKKYYWKSCWNGIELTEVKTGACNWLFRK